MLNKGQEALKKNFCQLVIRLYRYILSIRPFLCLGVGDLKYMEEITPVDNQAIVEIICIENKKNASLLSGKRVQK